MFDFLSPGAAEIGVFGDPDFGLVPVPDGTDFNAVTDFIWDCCCLMTSGVSRMLWLIIKCKCARIKTRI